MAGKCSRQSQTERIVALLRSRSPNWVPLPEILELRISQYSARVHQARHEWGLRIENRLEIVNGQKHSWFRLLESSPQTITVAMTAPSAQPANLFGKTSFYRPQNPEISRHDRSLQRGRRRAAGGMH